MKKGTLLGIVCAVAAIIALGVLTCYLTLHFRKDIQPTDTDRTASEAESAVQALYSQSTEQQEIQTELLISEEIAASYPFLIWVGDSRTMGMGEAVEGDNRFIGASGEGYYWLAETGLSLVEDAIAAFPDTPVIFNFGVNDYDNLSNYLDLYQDLATAYPDTHFYFLSVNPVDPAACKNITNEEIADFNAHLKERFPEWYIDSFTHLMVNEVGTIDGIHYSEDGYRMIYEFAASKVVEHENTLGETLPDRMR